MVPLSFAGHEWHLTRSGGLFWRCENALLVADLHLETASFFAARGQSPPYDSRETLERVALALREPARGGRTEREQPRVSRRAPAQARDRCGAAGGGQAGVLSVVAGGLKPHPRSRANAASRPISGNNAAMSGP